MFEYEFRIAGTSDENEFKSFFEDARAFLKGDFGLFTQKTYRVFYVKPHFRMKEMQAPEWKRVLSTRMIYQDNLWFKFVESEEIPFAKWTKPLTIKYLQNAGHYFHSVSIECRHEIVSETFPNVKMYAFRKFENMNPRYGRVFEFEMGTFEKKQSNLLVPYSQYQLCLYKRFYRFFRNLSPPPMSHCFFEKNVRKPVVPLHPSRARRLLASSASVILTAPKHDGTFGFVYSRSNLLREVWEDNVHRVHPKVSIGDDEAVFGAERMPDGSVVLLDVYRMRGSPVRTTQSLLTEFLPSLRLPEHLQYRVQIYRLVKSIDQLNEEENCDGIILHDVTFDVVYKLKSKHTIDLVHYDGYFWMPTGERIKVPSDAPLLNGSVYECELDTYQPIRRRDDRFVGNSIEQIKQLRSATFLNP